MNQAFSIIPLVFYQISLADRTLIPGHIFKKQKIQLRWKLKLALRGSLMVECSPIAQRPLGSTLA